MRPHHRPPPSPGRSARQRLRLAGAALLALAAALSCACSLVVETRGEQCDGDSACAHFPNAVCDLGQHVCVPRTASGGPTSTGSGAGGGCAGAQGCYACAPTTSLELLNACTMAACVPFDNRTRLTHLGDGGLPPLP